MNLISNRFIVKLLIIYASIAYRSAKSIIALSTGMRSSLLSRYRIKSNIIVAPNFFDRAEFESPITKPDLIQHLHSQSKKVVVYTGTLGFVNDPEYIAKLAYYSIGSPCILLLSVTAIGRISF